MTCNFCKNGNMTWCLTNCYSDTFKCKNCESTLEIKQNKDLFTDFIMVWSKSNKQ